MASQDASVGARKPVDYGVSHGTRQVPSFIKRSRDLLSKTAPVPSADCQELDTGSARENRLGVSEEHGSKDAQAIVQAHRTDNMAASSHRPQSATPGSAVRGSAKSQTDWANSVDRQMFRPGSALSRKGDHERSFLTPVGAARALRSGRNLDQEYGLEPGRLSSSTQSAAQIGVNPQGPETGQVTERDARKTNNPAGVKREMSFARKIMSQSRNENLDESLRTSTLKMADFQRNEPSSKTKAVDRSKLLRRSSTLHLFSPEGSPNKETLTRLSNEDELEQLIQSILGGSGPKELNLRAQLDGKCHRLTPSLFDALGSSNAVQALNLGYNPIVDSLSGRLAQALCTNYSLTTLHLASTGLSEASCVRLVSALRDNCNGCVRELYLGRNKAGQLTTDAIAEAISCGHGGLMQLKVLSLSNNRIGDEGGAVLCKALLHNRKLQVLDVGSNMLGARTCNALAEALRENAALRELRIERNPDLENERLSQVIISIVGNEKSALKVIHSLEPLSKFCWDPAIRRHSGEWDNTRVMRFVWEVRENCSPHEDSTKMFPIDVDRWQEVKAKISRQQSRLQLVVLRRWQEVVQRRLYTKSAVAGMVDGPSRTYSIRRFWFLWRDAHVVVIAEREKEPGFQRKLEGVARSCLLVSFAAWRLSQRHQGWLPCGRKCHLSEQLIAGASRRFGAETLRLCHERQKAAHSSDVVFRHRTLLDTHRTLLRCLYAWQGLVLTKQAAARVARQLTQRATKHKTLARCVRSWSTQVVAKTGLRRKGERLSLHHPKRVVRSCVSRWAHATETAAQRRRRGMRVELRHQGSLLKRAWVAWGVFVGMRHDDGRKDGQATRAQQLKWFKRWVLRRREATAEGGRWQLAGSHRRKRLTKVTVLLLREHRDRSAALRYKACKLAGSSVRHQLRESMRTWTDNVQRARVTRRKLQGAQGGRQKDLRRVAFAEWRGQQLQHRTAGRHGCRALMRRVWAHLRQLCEDTKAGRYGARAVLSRVAAGMQMEVRDVWDAWSDTAAEAAEGRRQGERRAGNMSRAVQASRQRLGLLEAFSRWMSYYLDAVRKDAAQIPLVEARHQQYRAVTAWVSVLSGEKGVRLRVKRNDARMRRMQMARVFLCWTSLVSTVNETRVAQGLALFRVAGALLKDRRLQACNLLARLARRSMLDLSKALARWRHETLRFLREDERVTRQAAHFRRWFDKGHNAVSLLSCFIRWRSLCAVQLSHLKGCLAFRGGLPASEMRSVATKCDTLLPAQLLEIEAFEAAGHPAAVVEQVLQQWWERKEQGSAEHAVELHRFWSLLAGQWAGASIPLALRTCTVTVVGAEAAMKVKHSDAGDVQVELPKLESTAAMELRMRRAINVGLDLRFESHLRPACALLAAAKHFCEVFLEIPHACLDARGDHEAWTCSGVGPAHVRMVGVPPRPSPVPEGWARVGLRLDEAVVEGHDVWKEWHVSFHGTRRELVKEIVMSRMLLLPGDINCRGKTVQAPPGHLSHDMHHRKRLVIVPGQGHQSAVVGSHLGNAFGSSNNGFGSVRWKPMGPEVIEEYDRKELRHRPEAGAEEFLPNKYFFTSPSIRYAAQHNFAVPFMWQERKAQVVLQTRQCPRFVRVAHTKKTPSVRLEECFRPEEVSWFSRVYGPGSILITGVLFRFVDDQ